MENKRRFGRFDTQLKAQYISQDNERNRQECTVINMSRKGIGIRFHSPEKISVDTNINLEVFIPEKLNPVNVEGVLRWVERKGTVLFGGIESKEILDEMKFSKSS